MTLPLLPGTPPAVCRDCGHKVPTGRLYGGLGVECARQQGLLPRPQLRVSRRDGQDGQNLFDLFAEETPVIETLHSNEWLSLRVVRAPERGINGYVFSHEGRCQGRIVAVLPYADTPTGRRYLVRSEVTPCWSLDPQLSAITGGFEGGDIEDDAVRELLEEAGYAITRDDLIPLGVSYASKSADTVYSLFAVDVTGKDQGAAAGDGSRLEAEGSTVWLNEVGVCSVQDPQVAVMVLRLGLSEQAAVRG